MLLFIALLLDAGKKPSVRELEYSVMEINHRYDDQGRHCYDQIILWDWNPQYRRHHVALWLLIDQTRHEMPRKVGDMWYFTIPKLEGPQVKIKSKIRRETWTDYDPERKDKELFDEKYRRGLK